MAKTNILALTTLCAIFGVGLIQARILSHIPNDFIEFDSEYTLGPKVVERLGNNRVVFKFGDEEQRGELIKSTSGSEEFDEISRQFKYVGGYPELQDRGVTEQSLTYAEITIEADTDALDVKFVSFYGPHRENNFTYFRYKILANYVKRIKYTLNVYGQ